MREKERERERKLERERERGRERERARQSEATSQVYLSYLSRGLLEPRVARRNLADWYLPSRLRLVALHPGVCFRVSVIFKACFAPRRAQRTGPASELLRGQRSRTRAACAQDRFTLVYAPGFRGLFRVMSWIDRKIDIDRLID